MLSEKIKSKKLTRTQKVIAEYFVNNTDKLSFQTASSIAYDLGVSDTSVIRLVRILGFDSFQEFQKQMREETVARLNESARLLSPAAKYRETIDHLQDNDLINNLMEQTFTNIQKTMEAVDPDDIEKIIYYLKNAKRKYITGFRGSSSLANFLGIKLRYLFENVKICTQADSELIESIIDLEENDLLIIISFPIYTTIIQTAIDIAHENKAKIVVITDKITSPVTRQADVVLTTSVNGLGFSNSYVAPMCLIDMILLEASKDPTTEAEKRINRVEHYLEELDLH